MSTVYSYVQNKNKGVFDFYGLDYKNGTQVWSICDP